MNAQIVHAAMIKKASQNKQSGVDDILKALGKGADNISSWAKGLFGKKKAPQIDMDTIRNNAFIKTKAPGVKDLTEKELKGGFFRSEVAPSLDDIVEKAKRIGEPPEEFNKLKDLQSKSHIDQYGRFHVSGDGTPGLYRPDQLLDSKYKLFPRLRAYRDAVDEMYTNESKLREALLNRSSSKMNLSPEALSSKAGLTQPGPFSHVDDQTFRQNLRDTAGSNANKLEEAAKDFYWRRYNKQVPLIDDTAARPLPKDSYPWSNLKRLRVEELAQNRDAAIDNVKKYSDLMRTNGGKVNIKDLINSSALKSSLK